MKIVYSETFFSWDFLLKTNLLRIFFVFLWLYRVNKKLIDRLNDGQVEADQTEEEEPSGVDQDQVYYIII